MKALLRVVTVLLVLVLIVGTGAAWYFSNLTIAGASVDGAADEYVHQVTALQPDGDSGTITYTAGESVEDPATDNNTRVIVGLRFADGSYLQLAQGATVDGRSITRRYVLLAGQPPAVGAFGQYDWNAYPDAASLGASSTEVTYDAPGGPTRAIVVDPSPFADPTDLWVVVAHGRNSSIREGLRAVPLYAERGMTTMLINYRDDEREEGVPQEDGIGNFGLTEWEDLQAAVQYAVDAGAGRVILVGWSMGGAVVASYLERGANTDVVVGTQLDSPAVSFSDVVEFGAQQLGLPTQPLAPLIWAAKRVTELRVNIDFEGVEYKDNAADWPVPAVVTAASEDDLVPPESIEAFAQALPDGRFMLFEGAPHTGEWNDDAAGYDTFIGSWLDRFADPAG